MWLMLVSCGVLSGTTKSALDLDGDPADSDADADADSDADADADSDADSDTTSTTTTTTTTPVETGLADGCGDLTCGGGEDCAGCPVDCGPCPTSCDNDGTCSAFDGETCTDCPGDCDSAANVCGNGACDTGETTVNCMADCGPAPWPDPWAQFEDDVLVALNAERAAGSDCPSGAKGAVGPLQMDSVLRTAARRHSWDQSYSDYFSHYSCNGRDPWTRAPTARAENIAWGYSTPAAAVAGWMGSTEGHCDAIMDGNYDYVGLGYSDVGGNRLWTAMFR